jgi:hypothetical protein
LYSPPTDFSGVGAAAPIFHETGLSEHRRPMTHEVSKTELQEWQAPMTGPESARALVRAMADEHPDLFTDTAKPPTES